ncbi:amine oxidase [Clohesyomyces aquaticus]|uniref:Amine oxidase n=1 Tax=Clohesyomyces aquaticus TaxID=1231657 RepID=A0A1Y1ZW23_9PLEO|nr:amine oxidase [Clohesyomyces aquaticus]
MGFMGFPLFESPSLKLRRTRSTRLSGFPRATLKFSSRSQFPIIRSSLPSHWCFLHYLQCLAFLLIQKISSFQFIMEHRTYIHIPRTLTDVMTRIKQDLSGSPHQEGYLEANGDTPMLRRALGRIPHVCIIGAGVAGLRCADVLLQQGVKVTILEGRNRVGGRLCQSNVGGHLVDLGANWIHGTDDNPILDLAKETNTMTMTWDGRQSVFDHLGNHLPLNSAAEKSEMVWGIIEQAMQHSNEHSATIPAETSLYNFFEEKLEEIFSVQPIGTKMEETQERKREILRMAEMWGAFVGSPIQTQSLKFFWLEECIDGENLFVADTYRKILAKIAEPALAGAEVQYGKKVERIISSDQQDTDPKVAVRTGGGDVLTFDEVVLTAPLGWLKRNDHAFEPPLPNRLRQAIKAIGYGHLDKAYITFPKAFWNESPSEASTISSAPIIHQQSTPNVTATTAPVHQYTSPSIDPSHYPGFTHWMAPHYAPETNPSHWGQECVNLAALPTTTAHPTLLFYTFGPTSLHLASLLSKYPSLSDPAAIDLLKTFFTPYFSRLPNYDASSPDCAPSAILATAWANDELAGHGSYSNFQTGLEVGDQDIEVMRKGMPERGVWLAGEHTAPFVALGTVTGAWWSGEGVAKRILGAYGLVKNGVAEEN